MSLRAVVRRVPHGPFNLSLLTGRPASRALLQLNELIRTLEEELEKIHDAKIGVSITWLWDGEWNCG